MEKRTSKTPTLKALGNKQKEYKGLETFDAPKSVDEVILTSDEVTAVCPVTGQPDWYTVEVRYYPQKKCIESKTFKLFLQSLRNQGMFCEALAEFILKEVEEAVKTVVEVKITQKPRGGVSIVAVARSNEE